MLEHTWAVENLAGYVAGGLEPEERDQLEEHLAECPACARKLDEVRAVDHRLEALFAGVRPNPALEDRSIQALRQASGRADWRQLSRGAKFVLGAAAAVLLAAAGAGVSALIDEERMELTGATRANNSLKQLGLSFRRSPEQADLKDADTLAKEIRERRSVVLMSDISGSMAEAEGELASRTPVGGQVADLFARKAEVGMPGVVNPDEPVGVERSAQQLSDKQEAAKSPLVSGEAERSRAGSFGDGSGKMVTYSPDGRFPASANTPGNFSRRPALPSGASRYFRPSDMFVQQPPAQKAEPGKDANQTTAKNEPSSIAAGFGLGLGDKTKEGHAQDGPGATKAAQTGPPPPASRKVIIRSGNIEFEVNSFDAAVAAVTRLVVGIKGGFVDTVNSEKLPNGKMRGAVVVRVPPDQLDGLVLDLRKQLGQMGDLKGQRIASLDVTKQYTDMESRLRGARTMEERLLKVIRDGKGQIKDLVLAEQELGKWRTKIEEYEGELRYYANQAALSTLTINLVEKEIRMAAAVCESEHVQTGIEVEDVDKARREALKAIADAKGRVTLDKLNQQAAGQYSVLLNFEVDPEAAGPLRDRLRQLGTTARLEINRVQQVEGSGPAPKDGKIKRGPTHFEVSLYNLANVAPRETVTLKVASPDVRAAFENLRDILTKAKARVAVAQLNEPNHQNVTATLDFDIRRADLAPLQTALKEAGEVLERNVVRAPQGENFSDAKLKYNVELQPTTTIPPREIYTLALEVSDVQGTLTVLSAQVKETGGLVLRPEVSQERDGRVTAHVYFDVPLAAAPGLFEKFKSAGQVRMQKSVTNGKAPEGKLAVGRLDVTLSNMPLVSREGGLGAQVQRGVSFSLLGLAMSLRFLIVGVLFVLPWLLVIAAFVWVVRRLWRSSTPLPAVATAGPPGSGTPPPAG
jgi:hypothetical protein